MKFVLPFLVMVSLSHSAVSLAGKLQGIKQRVSDIALRVAPLSKKVAGGVVAAAVGATLLTAPLSAVDAHDPHKNRYAQAARETVQKMERRGQASSVNVVQDVNEPISSVQLVTAEQFYKDIQALRSLAEIELLDVFGMFKYRPFIPDGILRNYDLLITLRHEGSSLVDYFENSLREQVQLQQEITRHNLKGMSLDELKLIASFKRIPVIMAIDNARSMLKNEGEIPSSLEKPYLLARAELQQLTDQFAFRVISLDDYLTAKHKLLAQVKKDIDAKKRYRIRAMTRTSRSGVFRK